MARRRDAKLDVMPGRDGPWLVMGGSAMPIVMTDETLRQTGMTEREVVIEIACRLYDIEKLPLWPAAKMAGMSRDDFERELLERRIPIHRPGPQDLADDLATLERLRRRP